MKREILFLLSTSLLASILIISVVSAVCTDECQRGSNYCINETNYKVCGNYNSDSCLEYIDGIPCSNGDVCRNGECVNLSNPNGCIDSDGGLDYYKAGSLKGLCPGSSCGVFADICVNETTLMEYYCNYTYDYQNYKMNGVVYYNCPSDCIGNRCVNKSNNMVGNDSDEHGCKGSAGYSWCDEKKKCLRIWEENCSQKNKILPETASLRARERLGELGFNITLKEVGQNKTVYVAEAEKQGKFLGLFKIKSKVSAEIDSETGEVIKVHKPWWSFMAGI